MPTTADPTATIALASRLESGERERLLAAVLSLRDQERARGAVWSERTTSAINAIVGTLEACARQEKSEASLVDKLAAAGELRPSYLLSALKQKRLSVFRAALVKLGGFTPDQVREALNAPERPEILALACVAVGIDKAAFSTLLTAVRELNAGRPGGGDAGARRALGVFGSFSPDAAARAFAQVTGAV